MKPDRSIAAYGVVILSDQVQKIELPMGGVYRLSGKAVEAAVEVGAREVLLVEVMVGSSEEVI